MSAKTVEYALVTGTTTAGGAVAVTALMSEHGSLIHQALQSIEQVTALMSSL